MTYAFVGLMVLYRLTEDEAEATNIHREDARQTREEIGEPHSGFQAHVGNMVAEGDRVPMVVTTVSPSPGHGQPLNGQVFLDGNDSLWVADIFEGDHSGEWEAITDG